MKIRAYDDKDWPAWLRMSLALFPEYTAESLAPGMREFRARSDTEVFVAEDSDGAVIGFVEVGSRPYADAAAQYPPAEVRLARNKSAIAELARDPKHTYKISQLRCTIMSCGLIPD